MPTAVGKRVDTCGFHPLNSRFPLFLSLAQTRDRRPLRNRGTAVGLPVCRGAHCASITRPIRSSRIPYCYTGGLVCAGAAYLCRATHWSGGYGWRLRVLFDNECYRRVRRLTTIGHFLYNKKSATVCRDGKIFTLSTFILPQIGRKIKSCTVLRLGVINIEDNLRHRRFNYAVLP